MSKTSFTVGGWPHDPHLHDNHIFWLRISARGNNDESAILQLFPIGSIHLPEEILPYEGWGPQGSDGRRNPHLAGELACRGLGEGRDWWPNRTLSPNSGGRDWPEAYCVEVMHIYNNILPPEILTKRLFFFLLLCDCYSLIWYKGKTLCQLEKIALRLYHIYTSIKLVTMILKKKNISTMDHQRSWGYYIVVTCHC